MFTRLEPFTIGQLKVQVLGDTHLGRRFKTGVPLFRLGDRERMIHEDFASQFKNLEGIDVHVHMGDIFDSTTVSSDIIWMVIETYRTARENYPDCMFILLRGNHDATKDLEAKTSFDILALTLRMVGVTVADNEPITLDGMAFVPWHPIVTAQEMADRIPREVVAAFGHWDVAEVSAPHNLIPKIDCQFYVTGHDHKRRVETRHGKPVIVVGSMQPFKFGEDWEDKLYRTVTLEELTSIADTSNLCLKVVLKPDEDLPHDIDCFQITTSRLGSLEEIEDVVTLDGLDMNATMIELMTAQGVGEALQATIMGKYHA